MECKQNQIFMLYVFYHWTLPASRMAIIFQLLLLFML